MGNSAGSYNFNSITVTSSSSLTVIPDLVNSIGVTITTSSINVDYGTFFSGIGTGFPGSNGPGAGGSCCWDDGGGGGHAGQGGISAVGSHPGGGFYGDTESPITIGSGGGNNHNGPGG